MSQASGLALTHDIEFEGLSITGNAQRLMVLPRRLLDHAKQTCNVPLIEEAAFVVDVCRNPAGIWRGLNRLDQDEALVYCGIPSGEFCREHNLPFRIDERFTFMVFQTKTHIITKWRKCETSSEIAGYPKEHQTRFGVRLWPQD